MSISHVDVPASPVRSPACAAAAPSRLIPWCQRPRQEVKCFNSLAGSNPFSVFSLCSEFRYQEIHKYCSRFDLLTHALNVCHLFPAWLPGAQQLVVTLRPSKTDSFRLGQSLITARTASQICVVTAMQHYFQLAAPSSGPSFLFPVRQAPYQVSGHFPPTGYRASCRAFLFIALKVILFASVPPLQPLLLVCQTGWLKSWIDGPLIVISYI